jgi:hypothetical protein
VYIVDLRGDAPSGDMSEWNGDITAIKDGNSEQINVTLDHLILSVRHSAILYLIAYGWPYITVM